MNQSIGVEQFVHSTEVVHFSECPLSEAPLYTSNCSSYLLEVGEYIHVCTVYIYTYTDDNCQILHTRNLERETKTKVLIFRVFTPSVKPILILLGQRTLSTTIRILKND